MDYLQEVRKQYESYPYPLRDPEDERKRLLTTEDSFLEKINHYCYGGKQDFHNFRVLVAGGDRKRCHISCGTVARAKKY